MSSTLQRNYIQSVSYVCVQTLRDDSFSESKTKNYRSIGPQMLRFHDTVCRKFDFFENSRSYLIETILIDIQRLHYAIMMWITLSQFFKLKNGTTLFSLERM